MDAVSAPPETPEYAPDASDESRPGCGTGVAVVALLGWFAFVPFVAAAAAVAARGGPGLALIEDVVTGQAALSGPTAVLWLAGVLVAQLLGTGSALVFARRHEPVWGAAWLLSLAAVYAFVFNSAGVLLPPGDVRGPGLAAGAGKLIVALVLVAGMALAWRLSGLAGRAPLAEIGWGLPRRPAILIALACGAVLLAGWALTGSLGDPLFTLAGALGALAVAVGEETLFRGVGHVALNRSFRQTGWAALAGIAIFMAYLAGGVMPGLDFGALGVAFFGWTIGLLVTELRARALTVWPSVIARFCLVAGVPLFTDGRLVKLMGTLPPLHLTSVTYALAAAAVLGTLLFAARRARGGRLSLGTRWALAGAAALLAWLAIGGLWFAFGEPGFHPDSVIVVLSEQADLSALPDDPAERRAEVHRRLVDVAERSQPPLLAELERRGLRYRRFYLVNAVRVEISPEFAGDLAALPGAAAAFLNPNVRPYPRYVALTPPGGESAPAGVAPGVRAVRADEVWDLGVRGAGIVVAGADTGVDWTHPALQRQYRGWDGAQADHDYNWLDAWDGRPEPFDEDAHGTHTVGTMVGDDGTHQVGMAPEARWIACRNMRYGIGNPGAYLTCMEWFLAPYPQGGDPLRDGDPSRAPDVVNNSWGCPPFEGCDPDALRLATVHLRAAGVMMVVAAGNSGPACSTLTDPPAIYDAVFTVGAVDDGGEAAFFSNRGPVAVGSDRELKPDVAAPGVDVRSAVPGGGYGEADWAGTSMAGPHVAGLVALVWSADPELRGRIDETEALIRETAGDQQVLTCGAADITSAPCACGDEAAGASPNYTYGYGIIDALAAVEAALR
jgi:subtilisin family serine protease